MYLIVRYHPHSDPDAEHPFPPEQDWLPTWRIGGPDEESLEQHRRATVSLSGETRLPIHLAGEPLSPGEIYLDLRNPALGPFRALDGQVAGHGNSYIAQGDLAPVFWNQLVRVCARAGALMLDAGRSGPGVEVTIVLEPLTPAETPSPAEALS